MSGGLVNTPRVLVLDDDEIDRERVRRFLARAEFRAEVLEAADPAASLASLRQLAPDAVVLDYNFPRHDGLSVLRELRERDSTISVVVLTGYDDTALAVELMKAGAVDYIPKSALTPERLVQSLRHALRLRTSEKVARAAQEALRASEEFNRRVLESSRDCIKVLDLDGTLVSMSPGGLELLAIRDFTLLRGHSWLEFWKDEHRVAAEKALADARTGGVGRFVGFSAAEDGRALWFDVMVTPILDAQGAPERLLCISRDVTEQRRQSEFEQQLIGIVSHDLRNPISAMTMAATLLSQKLAPDSPLQAAVGRIVRSGKRATRLIHDLLDFTQARLGGGLRIVRRETDIHVVCRQTVEEIALNHPDRPIVHTPAGEGKGSWDPDRIAQVIGNLTRNAVAYSPAGSPVTVRSEDRGGRIRLEVHNEGRPIAPEVVPTLFRPFTRGEQKHSERSIGLGLFIVREIVASHGGTVDVRSTAVEGTTFSVDLPRS